MFRYVSLGCDCQVNHQIGLVQERGPTHFFDWIASPLDGLIHLLEQDFVDILDFRNLVPFYVENRMFGVIDTKYRVDFHHDFARLDHENRLRVLGTYTRRAQRFRQLFDAGSPPTYFIRRADLRDRDQSDQAALRLLDLLKSRRKDVRLLYLHEDAHRPVGLAPGFRSAFLRQRRPFSWQGSNEAWKPILGRTALLPFEGDGDAFELPKVRMPRFERQASGGFQDPVSEARRRVLDAGGPLRH